MLTGVWLLWRHRGGENQNVGRSGQAIRAFVFVKVSFGCAVLFVCTLQWHVSLEHLSLWQCAYMCMCVCVCIHVCVCAYMHVYAYMYVQDCVNLWCLAGFKSCTTKIMVFGESAICVNVSEWTMVFGSSSVKPALELFEKQCWRNCLETGLYWAHRDHHALNWSVVCMSGELKVCVDASKWWCLCLTT